MKTPLDINQVLELALIAGDYRTVYKFCEYATQVWGDIGLLNNVTFAPHLAGVKRNGIGLGVAGRKPFVRRRPRTGMLAKAA